MTNTNNEIDLIELYQKILVFIFNKFLIFLIFIAIGMLIGTAYYFKNAHQIKTDYLAETSDISKELIYSLTEKISGALNSNQDEILHKNLNISTQITDNIKGLNIDTSGNIINISIISESIESLLPFTEALLNYYNHQPFILKSQKIKQEKERNLIKKIDEEINTINKFQNQFLSGDKNAGVIINQLNGLNGEKLRLYQMKQEAEDKLRQKDAIILINQNDNIIKKNVSLIKILLSSVFISILATLLYFFIRFSINLKNKA